MLHELLADLLLRAEAVGPVDLEDLDGTPLGLLDLLGPQTRVPLGVAQVADEAHEARDIQAARDLGPHCPVVHAVVQLHVRVLLQLRAGHHRHHRMAGRGRLHRRHVIGVVVRHVNDEAVVLRGREVVDEGARVLGRGEGVELDPELPRRLPGPCAEEDVRLVSLSRGEQQDPVCGAPEAWPVTALGGGSGQPGDQQTERPAEEPSM